MMNVSKFVKPMFENISCEPMATVQSINDKVWFILFSLTMLVEWCDFCDKKKIIRKHSKIQTHSERHLFLKTIYNL